MKKLVGSDPRHILLHGMLKINAKFAQYNRIDTKIEIPSSHLSCLLADKEDKSLGGAQRKIFTIRMLTLAKNYESGSRLRPIFVGSRL